MIYESWSKRRSYAKRWSRWSRIKIFLLWRIHLERTITSELTSFNRITVHRSHPFGSNWIDDKNSNPFGMIWRRMLLENYQSGSEWSFRFLFWLIKYHLTFSRCRGCVIWCWRMIGHFLCIFFPIMRLLLSRVFWNVARICYILTATKHNFWQLLNKNTHFMHKIRAIISTDNSFLISYCDLKWERKRETSRNHHKAKRTISK